MLSHAASLIKLNMHQLGKNITSFLGDIIAQWLACLLSESATTGLILRVHVVDEVNQEVHYLEEKSGQWLENVLASGKLVLQKRMTASV